MYFKRIIEVRIVQQYFTSYHTFDSIKTLLVLVFPRYKKCWCAPLGVVNFLYDLKILKSIKLLFEREFIYVWNRKRFSMIWFCIWFKFNIIWLTMPCAQITIKQAFILLQQCVQLISFLRIKMSGAFCNGLIYALEYLALRMRFILFDSQLKGALCCYSADTLFVV